jgi:hypothetical protein
MIYLSVGCSARIEKLYGRSQTEVGEAMRKFLLCLLVLVSSLMAHVDDDDEIIVGETKANYFNDVWKRQLPREVLVNFVKSEKTTIIVFRETLGSSMVWLSENQRNELQEAISKYKKWRLKAIAEGVKLEKDIATITSERMTFRMGSDYQLAGESKPFTIGFFSQNKTKHQMLIEVPKLQSTSNEFITMDPETKYLDYNMVQELDNLLSEKTVQAKIKQENKKKKIADDFK